LSKWFNANKLTLNFEKFCYYHIRELLAVFVLILTSNCQYHRHFHRSF